MTSHIPAINENTDTFCNAINPFVDIEKLYSISSTAFHTQPANINREVNSVLQQLYAYRAMKKTGQL